MLIPLVKFVGAGNVPVIHVLILWFLIDKCPVIVEPCITPFENFGLMVGRNQFRLMSSSASGIIQLSNFTVKDLSGSSYERPPICRSWTKPWWLLHWARGFWNMIRYWSLFGPWSDPHQPTLAASYGISLITRETHQVREDKMRRRDKWIRMFRQQEKAGIQNRLGAVPNGR